MSRRRRGTGSGTRLAIFTHVLFGAALALVALLLANWLIGRPGLRQRIDLTQTGQNTLSTAALGVLQRLQDDVTIDVFFRSEEGPLVQVGGVAMQRTARLLDLFESSSGGRVDVRHNDPTDREAIEERRQQLKLRGIENCLIVSKGDRREVLRLRGDLAEFDPGRPRELGFRPPAIIAFKAEESIVQGILAVTQGETLVAYFTQGHGERDPFDADDPAAYGMLETLLVGDGYRVELWDLSVDGPVPDDCSVLAIAAPDVPFTPAELEAITNYIDAGGRALLLPHNEPDSIDRSSVSELLDRYGMGIKRGLVLRAWVDASGQESFGHQNTLALPIDGRGMAQHPVTNPLREGGRSVILSYAHALDYTRQPMLGATREILTAGTDTWLDIPPIDYRPDPKAESPGPFKLALVSSFVPKGEADTGALEQKVETRIAAVGAADLLCNNLIDYNGDFARNLFNWLASREYRVNISPRNPDLRRLPVGRTNALAGVTRVALWILPGVCLLIGILVAVLRARGGPRATSRPRPVAAERAR